MSSIPEPDWKRLRAMKDEKLALACEKILAQAERIVQERKGKEHAAYLSLWRVITEEDVEIARMFDNLRRSNALIKLMAWRKNGLLSDAELTLFSPETQQILKSVPYLCG